MHSDIIRSYLWQEIINLGFNPVGRDQKKWVHMYVRSLYNFWEIGAYPNILRVQSNDLIGEIDSGTNLSFDFVVSAKNKFLIQFLFSPSDRTGLMWQHDVDSNYFNFPIQPFLGRIKRKIVIRNHTKEVHIEHIVDGLLCHPRTHQHIQHPINDHNIRFGGGIDNAFIFLFHLRYQLCPIPEKQRAERQRLITLFLTAINNRSNVTISDLMAQPEIA